MKKILLVVGTRPEAIKLAPVFHELRNRSDVFKTHVCLTGQHREMLYQAVDYFEIEVNYDLKAMKNNQNLSELTATLANNFQKVVDAFRPQLILVQGDTTSALVGALAGYYNRVQVGHIEAGLRSMNKFSPFPEELNRKLIAVLADHHFAPTRGAEQTLLSEGVLESRIIRTGNTVIDALFFTLKKIEKSPPSLGSLEFVVNNGHKVTLITGHRRENFGEGLENICDAIRKLAEKFDDVIFIYAVHLNPNVQKPVSQILGNLRNVYLVPPLGYVPFVHLLSSAHLVITDSGGIQEEAPSLGKPVLVTREVTERPEAVEAGTAILVGTDQRMIFSEASRLLENDGERTMMTGVSNPFGDGQAARRIVEYISKLDL